MFAARIAALVLLLTGCAGATPPPTANGRDAFRLLTIETPEPVRGGQSSDALARALLEVGRDAGVELHGDGRLARLAERVAGNEAPPRSAGAVPPIDSTTPEALVTAARALDLGDAALVVQHVQARAVDLLPAALRVELPAAVQALRATHFGVYVLPGGRGALVVLSRRPFVLDAVPRRIAANATLHLRGRRAADVQGATLVWSDPYGQSRAFALGSDLELDVRLPTHANGPHRVELREQTGDHERTLLAFTVDVGDVGDSDERGTAVATTSDLEREQLAAVRSNVLAQLAALRSERGLAPFDADASLGQRAGERCLALRAAPSASGNADAGKSADGVQTAIAHGLDASALSAALAADPALHERLLASERGLLGLALCSGPAGLLAVALFAPPPRTDEAAELASGRVLLAINAHRRTRAAPPLRPDAALTEVAQRAATALLADPKSDQTAIMERANAELEHYALRYRRVAAVAVVVHDASEAATLEPALDAGASVVGIATAELHDKDPNAPRIAVILALGWER